MFTVLLFLGSLFEKNFRERTFVFGCRCWSCVFWCCFAYVLLYYLAFRSRKCLEKILLMSGLVFLGFFFSLWFFRRRRRRLFCFFKRDSLSSNRAHPHTHLCCLFLFLLLSRRIYLFTLFGRASCFLVFSLGCHSGPHAFLGFSWYSSEALFLDARRQGCFGRFFLLFLFSPSVVFCGLFHTN